MPKDIAKFIEAQQKAEAEGKKEFVCPICGSIASWDRAESNKHLHSRCKGCGVMIFAFWVGD